MRRLVVLALLGATVLALSACSSPVTADRLAGQFGPSFARLYVDQQQQLGHATAVRGPDGTARCGRGGVTQGGRGAGDDWTCTVAYPFPDGHLEPIVYDVTVQATGCWTADGPGAVVGRAQLTRPDGAEVLNPLFAIDGCLDLG